MEAESTNGEKQSRWQRRRDAATEDSPVLTDADESSARENADKRAFLAALEEDPQLLVSTAGSSFEGMPVRAYLDTISADGVVGSGLPSMADAVIADLTDQRSLELAQKMERAKRIAWEELLWRAHKLGADGVLGVRYDVYMPFAGAFGASVTATAVKLDRQRACGELWQSE